MQIGELIDSEIMQLYPKEFAQELLNMFMPSAEPEQPQVSQEDTANHQEEQVQQAPAQNMTQTMPQQGCTGAEYYSTDSTTTGNADAEYGNALWLWNADARYAYARYAYAGYANGRGMHQHRMLMYLQQHFSHFQQMSIL